MTAAAFSYFRRLERVDRFVRANLAEDICLADVAGVAGMNASAFSRFFRRSVGVCFVDWLARERVERAKELIAAANLPISQVAVEVGYGSERAFRRAFRRFVGVSPSTFRSYVRTTLSSPISTPRDPGVRSLQSTVR